MSDLKQLAPAVGVEYEEPVQHPASGEVTTQSDTSEERSTLGCCDERL